MKKNKCILKQKWSCIGFYLKAIKSENGQSMVIFALLLVLLLACAALVADIGYVALNRAMLQNAADAAALAGVQELPGDPYRARIAATDYLEKNGQSAAVSTVTISPDKKSLMVSASRTDSMLFGKVLGVTANTTKVEATAGVGIAASVPWIVPFVIPKPESFNYDNVYVMRMHGGGNFLDNPKTSGNITGYPVGYNYPSDYRNHSVYRNYPVSNPYPYQFDYMNVYIKKNTNFYNYINWLENGFHESFSVNQNMFYYAPSSGGKESVDAFGRRASRDPNTDYKRAELGDARVMLIPVVESMKKRNTNTNGSVHVKIIGFVGYFIEKVHKNNYGESFWFEGRFLENLNVGSGEITYDTDADFGLRAYGLTQ